MQRCRRRCPFVQSTLALHRDGYNDHEKCGTVEVDGDTGVMLDYPIDDYLMHSLVQSTLEVMEIQFAAGAEYVDAVPHRRATAAEHGRSPGLDRAARHRAAATARRLGPRDGRLRDGRDAKHSVVDEWGRHRVVDNLSVIDGSVFPTSLGVNPQESIYALASKNASALVKAMASTALPLVCLETGD